MKTAINNVETWREYQKWRKVHLNSGLHGQIIPDEQLKLINREGREILSIFDLSHDVVRQLVIDNGKKLVPGFIVDENNCSAIDAFVMWLRRDEAFLKLSPGYSFRKGLLLRGPIGSGKTLLFKSFIATIEELKFFAYHIQDRQSYENDDALALEYGWNNSRGNKPRIIVLSSNAIAEAYAIDGFDILLNDQELKTGVKVLLPPTLFVDDIGSEPIYAHYGSPANIIGEIIIRRYERAGITHGTSNLSTDELKQVYGPRVFDRMRAMFNDLIIKGESRR